MASRQVHQSRQRVWPRAAALPNHSAHHVMPNRQADAASWWRAPVSSFIHIQDVVRATLQLANEEPGSTWHLSSQKLQHPGAGRATTLCRANFNALVQNSDERLGKDQSYLLDSTAMRQVHGWSDRLLEQGLQETLEWVNANLNTLNTLPWSYKHKT